jgi:hypothetical protein
MNADSLTNTLAGRSLMLLHPRFLGRSTASRIALVACLLAPAVAASARTTHHVSPCGDDAWSGLSDACGAPDGPKATIQAAIDASIDGDTVVLAPGTYVGPGNADLDFGGRAIALRSAGGDATDCVIEPDFGSRGFVFESGETAAAVVRGVTIRNGTGFTGGGAVRIAGSSPTFIDCVFEGNSASSIGGGFGGGVWVQDGSPTIINCVFRDNRCGNSTVGPVGRGGGMYVRGGSPAVIGCLFVGNTATAAASQSATGGALHIASGSPTVTNCAFVSNAADDSGGAIQNDGALVVRNSIVRSNVPDQVSSSSGSSIAYCNVEGGWPGQGNIDVDPLFVDAGNGDLRLLPGSPCIDAGHNWAVPVDVRDIDGDGNTSELIPLDLDGHDRFAADPIEPDTGCGAPAVVDMGAYEHQGEAIEPVIFADIDADGTVGMNDLLHLLVSWGACDACCLSDLDLDGLVGVPDLLALLAAW